MVLDYPLDVSFARIRIGIAKKASDSSIDRNQSNCSAESTLVIIPAILRLIHAAQEACFFSLDNDVIMLIDNG